MRHEIENYDEIVEALAWSPRKLKNLEANFATRQILTEGVVSMFERTGYPESVNTHILEKLLVACPTRCAAIVRYPSDGKNAATWAGKWAVGACDVCGEPDPDGFGKTAIVRLGDATVVVIENWRESDDIIVSWNSYDYSKDIMIEDTARKIQIADVSLDMLVKNSRLHPLPVAKDSKEQAAINDAQENILNGEVSTVLAESETKQIIDAISGNDKSEIEVLTLTDPEAAVHIQNITQYREDLWRWFWNVYGMDSRGTTKRAQQSVEEIDQGGDLSMIVPMARWVMRQLEAEEVSRKCGVEAACDFSTCWKSRIMEAVTIDDETAEKLDVENMTTDDENVENEAQDATQGTQEEGEEETNDAENEKTV